MSDRSRSSKPAQAEVSLAEAAKFLNVTLDFVVQQVDASRLPAKETGSGKVIPMDALRIYRQSLPGN